eukprot:13574007-Alexandrium_andersonii.AAC.1
MHLRGVCVCVCACGVCGGAFLRMLTLSGAPAILRPQGLSRYSGTSHETKVAEGICHRPCAPDTVAEPRGVQ